MGDTDNVMNTLRKGMDKSFFEQRLTAIRKEFRKAYGSEVTKRLIISTKRDGKGYKLELSPQQIDIK